MPHIHVTVKGSDNKARAALGIYRESFRQILADVTEYEVESIALIPRILTEHEEALSDNMYQLMFVVDLGSHPEIINGHLAMKFRNKILEIPVFHDIEFGVWLRKFPENSHAEHIP